MSPTPRLTALAGSLAALVLALVPLPAQAAATSYVALGDSYSSGTGTRTYLDDGTSCQRSVYAYPSLIATARGYALNFRACSGAKVADVLNTQLTPLSATTGYVTLSVGGNDAGFASVLTTCALPSWASNCYGAIDKARAFIRDTLPGRLSTLYAAIRSRAPGAKVVVVGYPRIFNGEDCNAFTWFSPTEESRLNATADLLNATTSTVAAAKGLTFANPTSRFVGHAVCDDAEWINGLSNPVSESYHPKVSGHRYGYTPAVSPVLTGTTVTASRTVMRAAARSADRLARQQRAYAATDSSITAPSFRAPDLHSPRVLRAADRAGVDVDDRASVAAADRRWDRRARSR